MKVPKSGDSAKTIAKGKGVRREAESERSRRQTAEPTNRNLIRQPVDGELARQSKPNSYPETRDVNEAATWRERVSTYPRISHGRGGPSPRRSKACREKSAKAIVPDGHREGPQFITGVSEEAKAAMTPERENPLCPTGPPEGRK